MKHTLWSFCNISLLSLIRFGTRKHFEIMVIIKVDTINDNVVTTGCTISYHIDPCAISIVRPQCGKCTRRLSRHP